MGKDRDVTYVFNDVTYVSKVKKSLFLGYLERNSTGVQPWISLKHLLK